MRDTLGIVGVMLMISTWSSTLYADRPHGGGFPPGLQKKYERGDKLPPGWRRTSSAQEYGYDVPLEDQYEPIYLEDKVIRIIKDVRDLADAVNR